MAYTTFNDVPRTRAQAARAAAAPIGAEDESDLRSESYQVSSDEGDLTSESNPVFEDWVDIPFDPEFDPTAEVDDDFLPELDPESDDWDDSPAPPLTQAGDDLSLEPEFSLELESAAKRTPEANLAAEEKGGLASDDGLASEGELESDDAPVSEDVSASESDQASENAPASKVVSAAESDLVSENAPASEDVSAAESDSASENAPASEGGRAAESERAADGGDRALAADATALGGRTWRRGDRAAVRAQWRAQQHQLWEAETRIMEYARLGKPQDFIARGAQDELNPFERKLREQLTVFLRERYNALNGVAVYGAEYGALQLSVPELKGLTALTVLMFALGHDLGKLKTSFDLRSLQGKSFADFAGSLDQFLRTEHSPSLEVVAQVGRSTEHEEQAYTKALGEFQRQVPAVYAYLERYFKLMHMAALCHEAYISRILKSKDGALGALSCSGEEFIGPLIANADRMAVAISKERLGSYSSWSLSSDLKFYLTERAQLCPLSINHRYSDLYVTDSELILVSDSLAQRDLQELCGLSSGQGLGTLRNSLRALGHVECATWQRLVVGADLIYVKAKAVEFKRARLAETYQEAAGTQAQSIMVHTLSDDPLLLILINALAQCALEPKLACTQVPSFTPSCAYTSNSQLDCSKVTLLGANHNQLRAALKARVTASNVLTYREPFTSLPQRIVVVAGQRLVSQPNLPLSSFDFEFVWEQRPKTTAS